MGSGCWDERGRPNYHYNITVYHTENWCICGAEISGTLLPLQGKTARIFREYREFLQISGTSVGDFFFLYKGMLRVYGVNMCICR